MTAAAVIQRIARESGVAVQAVETAAHLEAPFISTSKTVLCPALVQKLTAGIERRIKKAVSDN